MRETRRRRQTAWLAVRSRQRAIGAFHAPGELPPSVDVHDSTQGTLRFTHPTNWHRTVFTPMATDLRVDPIGEINKYDFRNEEKYVFKSRKGLDRNIVAEISEMKREPAWMRDFRLKSLEIFDSKPVPRWGGDIPIKFEDIYYYLKPTDHQVKTWDEVPAEIKNTFDRLGIPEAEKKFLAGVKAQYESEVVYGSLREEMSRQGVVFTDTDSAVRDHSDLLREYFGTIIPPTDNKFAALNSAVWSGGSFIYVPKGVKVEFPLQAYFRINAANMGQFERTLIIVDEGAQVHYVEGCTAPMYSTESLHSAVVEVIAKRGSPRPLHDHPELGQQHLQPRHEAGHGLRRFAGRMGRLQSGQPADHEIPLHLHDGAGRPGRGALGGLRFGGPAPGRRRQAGPLRPHTSGRIISKSISKNGGRSSYRGLVRMCKGAKQSKSNVVCDALILDSRSRSDTYPYIEIEEPDVMVGHEASVSRIGEEQLFYLSSRGLSEAEAATMIVSGFIEPLVKELPMEYAVEMNRLIELQMEGTVG